MVSLPSVIRFLYSYKFTCSLTHSMHLNLLSQITPLTKHWSQPCLHLLFLRRNQTTNQSTKINLVSLNIPCAFRLNRETVLQCHMDKSALHPQLSDHALIGLFHVLLARLLRNTTGLFPFLLQTMQIFTISQTNYCRSKCLPILSLSWLAFYCITFF